MKNSTYLQFGNTLPKLPKVPDLIKDQYNNCKLDHVWFVDFTCLGNFWILILLDATSKRIIAFQIKQGKEQKKFSFTTKDCITTYNQAFNDKVKPKVIHSVQAEPFLSKTYQIFLEKLGIQQSMHSEDSFQIIEIFFKTLKNHIAKIDSNYTTIKHYETMLQIVTQSIELYNNSVHFSLMLHKPEQSQATLAMKSITVKNKGTRSVPFSGKSPKGDHFKANEVESIKATVVQQYAGNWIDFFIQWRNQTLQEIKEIVQKESQKVIDHQRIESQKVIDHQSLEINAHVRIPQGGSFRFKTTYNSNAKISYRNGTKSF